MVIITLQHDVIVKEWVEKVEEAYQDARSKKTINRLLKMTPPRVETIYKSIIAGNAPTTACRSAGLGSNTMPKWKEKAKEDKEPYKTFVEGMDVMEALSEEMYLGVIHETALNGGWTAAAWKLERSYPERYARKERMDLSTDKDIKIEIKGVKSSYEMDEDEKELLKDD